MMWLTWRQHRRQVLVTGAALLVLAALMVPTGLMTRNAYADKGLAECVGVLTSAQSTPDRAEACNRALHQFSDQFGSLSMLGVLFLVLPLVVGLFWALRWSPARSSRAPTGSPGRRASAVGGGRWSSSGS
ncbi:hypothetical protein [Micromonospora globbae]|uniref:hypothetical protein n=1 Tax=Micromonospora globbae TaxID=1894969 RepID=UPI001F00D6FB|nr:hypothetical protein [Micromonospora globbae]